MSRCTMHICLQPSPPYFGHGSAAVASFSFLFPSPVSVPGGPPWLWAPSLWVMKAMQGEAAASLTHPCFLHSYRSSNTQPVQYRADQVSLCHLRTSFLFPAAAWPFAKSEIVKVQTGDNMPYFMDFKMPLPSHFLSHLQCQELSYSWS